MKLQLIPLLLFSASFCFAQKKIVGVAFLKNNGRYVNAKDSADYLRFVSEPDSGSSFYNVVEYYKDGKRKLVGKSSKIEPPVFEEQYARFYKSGKRQMVANFKNGTEVGIEYYFYPNGKIYTIKEYPDNNDKYNDFTGNFLLKANYDSLGTALVENGSGYFKGYDDDFAYISEEGRVKNGKRDSVWKGVVKKPALTFSEVYKNGELINGTATFGDEKIATHYKTRATPPQFKGGLDSFIAYLGANIQYPVDARQDNIEGTAVISFVVEKDGKVTDAKVNKSVSASIDAEALRVLRNSPRWIPGTQYGRNVRVSYSVPVSFKLNDN